MFKTFEIGRLFIEGREKYQEGIRFDINDYGCNLNIFYNTPRAKEKKAINQENFRIRFYVEEEVIIMLFKFGNLDWMDAPYSVHLSENLTKLNELEENKGLPLTINFIDANTGILKVKRFIGLENNFSKELISKVNLQKELAYEGFESRFKSIYQKYTTEKLARMADVIVG